jgi:hypothetical protein
MVWTPALDLPNCFKSQFCKNINLPHGGHTIESYKSTNLLLQIPIAWGQVHQLSKVFKALLLALPATHRLVC